MARPLPRPQSNTWFLARWPYRIFVLRELSAVVLAAYVLVMLVLATRVHEGAAAFEGFVETLQSPLVLAFHAGVLLFAVLHSVTWFQAVPKGLPLRRGEEKVPPVLLIGANYVVMAVLSVLALVIVLV